MPIIQADTLRKYCAALFEAKGVPHDEAERNADNLVDADLKGVESHGTSRMGNYLARLEAGVVNPKADQKILLEFPGTARIDACNSLGAETGCRAMKLAIDKAGTTGVSFVTVFNSNHYSAAAYFAQMALDRDMIGFTATNGPARVAPWGGRSDMFGTNPFAFAIPAGACLPILGDMATCVVARGKIIMAAKKGESIPLGWARDKDGNDTADARAALEGSLLPFGGHKGYAISLLIETLTGLLSGAAVSPDIPDNFSDFEHPNGICHFFGAINIAAFQSPADFKAGMDAFILRIKNSPRGNGVDEIFMPGEIELRTKAERIRSGIPLAEVTLGELRQLGEHNGVERPF